MDLFCASLRQGIGLGVFRINAAEQNSKLIFARMRIACATGMPLVEPPHRVLGSDGANDGL